LRCTFDPNSKLSCSLVACFNPLGMEAHELWDSDITASEWKNEYNPYKARLNGRSGWWAYFNLFRRPFIQVKLDSDGEFTVTGVATQPMNHVLYVQSFTISYSSDGIDWVEYREDGEVKVGT